MSTVVTQITEYVIEIQSSGATGPQGAAGVGVPTGGTTGQVLAKNSNTAYDTEWIDSVSGVTDHGALTGLANDDHSQYHNDARGDIRYEAKNANIQSHISSTSNPHSVTATQVGLGNVDNTSDVNKPISNATQLALNNKQDSISGLTIGNVTVASNDKVLIQDTSNLNVFSYVTAQDVADLKDVSAYALDTNVVHKTGTETIAGAKTFTDDISLVKASGTARSIISAANATDPKILSFRTANVQRWAFRVDGANDDIFMRRYDNAGAFIDAPMSADRTTGIVTINGATMVSKQDTLGFTPENVANKENTTIDSNTTKYPTVNLLNTGLSPKVNRSGDTFTGAVIASVTAPSYAGSLTLNASTANDFRVVLTGNVTINPLSSPTNGQKILIVLEQGGSGSNVATWDSVFNFPTAAGSSVLSTAVGKVDYFLFRYNGTSTKWVCLATIPGADF